jgi:uncharacterized protein (TIGR03435 family)
MIAALVSAGYGQNRGDLPPALVWSKVKGNCPASLDWASLRGKVVAASLTDEPVFPQDVAGWNETAGEFQGDPVLLIEVAGGSEFLLNQALQLTAFRGCILFDPERANLHNFKLPRFPRTVVVDQLGAIAGYSRGGPDVYGVRSVLNGRVETGLFETPPQPRSFDPAAGLDSAPPYQVRISPAKRGEARTLGGGWADRYIATNQPLKIIILDLWNMPMSRIAFPQDWEEGSYDVSARIPVADHVQLTQIVREAVEKQFRLTIDKEERLQRTYRLTVLGKPSSQLQAAAASDSWMSGGGQGSLIGTAQTSEDIVRTFEDLLEVPVVDGTGLKGKYSYSASSTLSGPDAAFDLAGQLGLNLTPAESPIEMLVVRKVQ